MSNSVQPHKRQPTRLPCPWNSPGKNTGVGRHFLLQCMKVKSESEVAQSCPTFSDPIDCSLPGSSIHGIFQARVLEWGAIAFSKEQGGDSSWKGRQSRCGKQGSSCRLLPGPRAVTGAVGNHLRLALEETGSHERGQPALPSSISLCAP